MIWPVRLRRPGVDKTVVPLGVFAEAGGNKYRVSWDSVRGLMLEHWVENERGGWDYSIMRAFDKRPEAE